MMNFHTFIEDPREENANPNSSSNTGTSENKEGKEGKPILEKIRAALQDWSNKDEADQEYDDSRV